MAKGGGCFVLWISLALITIPFYVFRAQSYIFHGKLGCSSVFHEANGLIENELNTTLRILRSPNYYSNISRTCQEADKCSHVIKNSAEHSGLTLSSLCDFFVFYNNSTFSSCAERLITRISQNVTCTDVIFRTGFEVNDTICQNWENVQNCLLEEIQATCEDILKTSNSTKVLENFDIFHTGYCNTTDNSSLIEMESMEDSETSEEILELSEVS